MALVALCSGTMIAQNDKAVAEKDVKVGNYNLSSL